MKMEDYMIWELLKILAIKKIISWDEVDYIRLKSGMLETRDWDEEYKKLKEDKSK